jgi:hypothetical protein
MEIYILGLWAMAWIICQIRPPDPTRLFILVLFLVLIFIAMFMPYLAPGMARLR